MCIDHSPKRPFWKMANSEMRGKAADNNRVFKLDNWTPRKLDKVLWTYGR